MSGDGPAGEVTIPVTVDVVPGNSSLLLPAPLSMAVDADEDVADIAIDSDDSRSIENMESGQPGLGSRK